MNSKYQQRAIIHVDMDAFFASVEELDNPGFVGHPVIVGGLGARGVVSAANYAARKFGIHAAMPIGQARRKCPDGIYCQGRMSRYQELSADIFKIFHQITPQVEGLSLDEAFLDVSASQKLLGDIETIGRLIKAKILAETGLIASVGMASNKFLAKLASDVDKPDGFYPVPDDVRTFLDPMPVRRIWGVGVKTAQRLNRAGILTIAQLRKADSRLLNDLLGSQAGHYQALARGEDEREVISFRKDKSISHEQTFSVDIRAQHEMLSVLQNLSEKVGRRLRRQGYLARIVILKVRKPNFQTYTRRVSLQAGTQSGKSLYQISKALLLRWCEENSGTPVRLLGVGTSGLELISSNDDETSKIQTTLDQINEKFGEQGGVAPTLGKLGRKAE